MPQLDREVGRGLPVWSKESAVFDGVLVEPHSQMEGGLDVRHRSGDIQVHAIAGGADHGKPVRLGEANGGVIILLAGTEPRGELLHR